MTEVSVARAPRWAYLPFQITSSAAAVLLLDQAVFAGQFLGGSYGALRTHQDNGSYAGIAVLVSALCAVLVRWPGRGPLWPLLGSLGLFALVAVQIAIGYARALTLHVPLGVVIIALAAMVVVRGWRLRP
jgi:hypothetical protein